MKQLSNGTIYNVIAFFDLFDYPLTAFEVWKYLPEKASLRDVIERLESGVDGVERKNGFCFLKGREEILDKRQDRYFASLRKFKKARRMAFLFAFVPWVRMVAVGNSIGANNLKDKGDIDFYIITQDRRIWISRFFCTGLAKLLYLRPRPGNLRDKICLSFYASEKAMDMRPLMLNGPDQEQKDIYFIYWLADLYPVYDQEDYYKKLVKANDWIFKTLPNWQFIVPSAKRTVFFRPGKIYLKIVDKLLGSLENLSKRLQQAVMPKELKKAAGSTPGVVINDQVLKFHLNDRRQEVRERYKQHVSHRT